MNALLPYWFLSRLPAAYDSPGARLRLRVELELGFRLLGFDYSDMQVKNAGIEGLEDLNGRRIDAIARRWGKAPIEVLLRLSRESRGATSMLFHSYSGDEHDESAAG